jgi:hypothetical protein
MGLLKVGVPLSLDSSKTFIAYVRLHGIRQFLHIWEAVKDIENVNEILLPVLLHF